MMRTRLRALCLAVAVVAGLAALGAGALAADDPVLGRWVLDEEAFRDQVERFYAAAMLQVPAEQQDRAQSLADEAIEATVARMEGSSALFRADGSVLLEPADGRPQTGSWSRDGERIVLDPAVEVPEAQAMIGTLSNGHLTLTPDTPNAVGFVMRRPEE